MRTEANAPPTDPADAWLSTTAAKDAAAARLHVLHARYGPNHSGGFSLHEAVTARPRDATSIRGLNPVLRELFIGLSDENSPLSKLSADLLYLVFLELSSWWEAHIVREGVFASSISSTTTRNITVGEAPSAAPLAPPIFQTTPTRRRRSPHGPVRSSSARSPINRNRNHPP